MYDLNKIVVIRYENDPEVVVMKTMGMKITDILYINKRGYLTTDNYKDIRNSIKAELYDDMYDDDLNIVLKESLSYEDEDYDYTDIASFIDDVWDKDSIVYTYGFDNDDLVKELKEFNGNIFIDYYYSMFIEGKNMKKPIETIMEEQGLNTQNMLKDSKISFMYFLHGLIEKMLSK